MIRKQIRSLIGKTRNERGSINEEKVKAAFASTPDNKFTPPAWFRKIAFGTVEQDSKGIDAIIYTWDVGKIYLQIKSSQTGLKKHKRNHKKIPVVVVNVGDTSKQIREKLFEAVKPFRESCLRKRGKSSERLIAETFEKRSNKKKIKKLKDHLARIICDSRWAQLEHNRKTVDSLVGKLAILGVTADFEEILRNRK